MIRVKFGFVITLLLGGLVRPLTAEACLLFDATAEP